MLMMKYLGKSLLLEMMSWEKKRFRELMRVELV